MNRKHLIPAVLLLLISLFSCDKNNSENPKSEQVTFRPYGLENKIVHELRLKSNELYAATNDGVFVRNITSSAGWQPYGLQGSIVKTLVFLPDGVCLAAGSNQAKTSFKVYKREPAASGFEEVNHNFGGGNPESLNNFFYQQATDELLAVGNNVVARSADKGATWTPIYNDWQGLATGLDFVQVNPLNGDIWAGGQNGIEGFSLIRYAQSTQTWQSWNTLLPSPSVAKDIAFDKTNPNTLLIGGEDGIIKTTDNGANWTIIRQHDHQARFYFGLELDEADKNTIYAASWVKDFENPQPLVLAVSKDGGLNWKEYTYQAPNQYGGVWDMVQVKADRKTKLYLGLYKGGVFEATVE